MNTMHLRRIAAAAAVAALPLAACAPVSGVGAGAAPMPAANGDMAAHAFLSAVDMNEMDMAMVAQDRAVDPTVRMYAMHMISSHSNALQARETHLAQRGAGLGLAATAWTPTAARWTTVAVPMRHHGGMQPAAGAARPEGEMQAAGAQNAVGVPPHGPPAHVQTADREPEGRGGNVQSLPAQDASGVPPHGPPAHLQDVGDDSRRTYDPMHRGMTWIGASMRHEPVLTPAGTAALRTTLVANPASRPLAEAAARDLERLRGLSGAQFDMAYIDAQVAAHRYALENLDATLAAGAVGPEMMGMVQATRAMIASHLETAEAIRARL